jgi:hypothetical protein
MMITELDPQPMNQMRIIAELNPWSIRPQNRAVQNNLPSGLVFSASGA